MRSRQVGQLVLGAHGELGVDVRGLPQVPPHQVVGVRVVVDVLVELVGTDHPGQDVLPSGLGSSRSVQNRLVSKRISAP